MFVHEHEALPILSSARQLEDTFNDRYRYDREFFCTEPPSDRFRRLTSNVTSATCIYEDNHGDNWNLAQQAFEFIPQAEAPDASGMAKSTTDVGHQPSGDSDAMAKAFAHWNLVAEDFQRRLGSPSLLSGSTVIDERNFICGMWK
ncbi:hypothetical protein RJ55_03853 [Drechmeria coniospora]|nr:hypothetical protein RJ55_03853 [Drechmeria coniospora]